MNRSESQEWPTRNLRIVAGHWRLARRLGHGGTANVYLTVNVNDGRRAAFKILRRDLVGQTLLEHRFLREAELTKRISHPGVLAIFDHGRAADGRPYILSELLDGETLDERRSATKERKLPWSYVVEVGLAVLEALAAAHDEGVVHRDVKPTNVFVTKDEQVKLLDFGIAGLGEDEASLERDETRTALGIGTPMFMAPEQLTGEDAIDGRADLFGVAATMFHAMSGRVPFGAPGLSLGALISAYGNGAADLRSFVPDVPRPVARVISRALGRRTKDRFATAREMAAALSAAASTGRPPVGGKASELWSEQTRPLPTVRRLAASRPSVPPPDGRVSPSSSGVSPSSSGAPTSGRPPSGSTPPVAARPSPSSSGAPISGRPPSGSTPPVAARPSPSVRPHPGAPPVDVSSPPARVPGSSPPSWTLWATFALVAAVMLLLLLGAVFRFGPHR